MRSCISPWCRISSSTSRSSLTALLSSSPDDFRWRTEEELFSADYIHSYIHTYIRMWLRWRNDTRLHDHGYCEWQKIKTTENVFYIKLWAKSSLSKWRLKLVSDDSDVTLDGRLFQTRDAAAAKERSPTVVTYGRRNDQRIGPHWPPMPTSAVRRKLSVRYSGAWPCRQQKVRTTTTTWSPVQLPLIPFSLHGVPPEGALHELNQKVNLLVKCRRVARDPNTRLKLT